MNDQMQRDMLEATRLTRAGRLSEATLFLQRMLRGGTTDLGIRPSPSEATSEGVVTLDLIPDRVEIANPDQAQRANPPGASVPPPNGAASRAARGDPRSGFRTFLNRLGAQACGAFHGKKSLVLGTQKADGAANAGEFASRMYSSSAGSRAYKIYVPSDYVGESMSLIVMLHGCTQSPDDFAAGTRMNALAEEHSCLVAYPAQASSANASKCWNWFSPDDQHRGSGEPSLIAGITREVMHDYAVDPRRVYVAGLSAGGAAAAIMGMTYPDLYAAIGVHSGLACGAAKDLPSAFAAMRQGGATPGAKRAGACTTTRDRMVPTIVFHGDADTTVHPRNGDDVMRQFEAFSNAGLQRSTECGEVPGGHRYSRTQYADPAGQVVLEQWVVHGAGHAWSGGSPAGSYTDPRGPNAGEAMVRFFLEHAMDES